MHVLLTIYSFKTPTTHLLHALMLINFSLKTTNKQLIYTYLKHFNFQLAMHSMDAPYIFLYERYFSFWFDNKSFFLAILFFSYKIKFIFDSMKEMWVGRVLCNAL